ncbi:MAG: NCS2 family permease [Oscillospiraceae bacterium]|nr:NCS2 family permease [Oscillospiraceae bacterium]
MFKLKENNTTVKTEFLAGLTTFMAMAYILFVNSGMFAELGVVSYNAIYIATALSAIVGTVLMGLLANLPLAQASGMGLNAFFVYTVCMGFGLSYANALVLILAEGLLFILLTVTGLRKIIFESIPKAVRVAIPAGIGLFIAFIGLQNAGIVVGDAATKVNLVSMNLLKDGVTLTTLFPIAITLLSLILMAALSARKVKGAVLWGILGGSVLYYVLGYAFGAFGWIEFAGISLSSANPFTAFKEFGEMSFGKVFTEGFDFSAYIASHGSTSLWLTIVTTSLAFCMVDMFDTIGTLFGACSRGNLLTKEGDVPNMNQAMLADAIATTTGAIFGTSTVTTYVESSAGVAEGGKTGLTAMFTALFFFIAMFFSPVASLIPGCATAAALVYVGVLMMNCVKDVDWISADSAVPAFLTLAIMAFTYNISYGIAFGMISYIAIKLFSGKIKETKLTTWIIALLFAVMFFTTH